MSNAAPMRKLHQFPAVRPYMTPALHPIGGNESLAAAQRLMKQHDVRQLPVVAGDHVIGVISQREVLLAASLPGGNPFQVKVAAGLIDGSYATTADAPLAEVVAEMSRRRVGSALIYEDGRCVGIFSTDDALIALAELLSEPA